MFFYQHPLMVQGSSSSKSNRSQSKSTRTAPTKKAEAVSIAKAKNTKQQSIKKYVRTGKFIYLFRWTVAHLMLNLIRWKRKTSQKRYKDRKFACSVCFTVKKTKRYVIMNLIYTFVLTSSGKLKMTPYARQRLPNQPVCQVYLVQWKEWLATGSIYALPWSWRMIRHFIVPSEWVSGFYYFYLSLIIHSVASGAWQTELDLIAQYLGMPNPRKLSVKLLELWVLPLSIFYLIHWPYVLGSWATQFFK